MGIPLELLEPAMGAARRALARMEEREVPVKLKGIAAKSGRRLPRPLSEVLLSDLDGSEWLREKTLETFEGGEGPAFEASDLYLRRPERWEESLDAITAEWSAGRRSREVEELAARLARAEARVGELSVLLDEERQSRRRLLEKAAADRDTAVRRAGEGAAEARRRGEELAGRLATLEEELDRERRFRQELEEQLGLLKTTRRRPERVSVDPSVPTAWSLRGDPLRLADWLDDLAAATRAAPQPEGVTEASVRSQPLALPPGVRPDRAEAIAWLCRQDRRVRLVVDGWNVAYLLAGDREPNHADRERVVIAARRLAKTSASLRRPVVLFDSLVGEERFAGREVEVRFVASADEAAIAASQTKGPPVVVISSDRRVREEVEAAGGLGLWSEALAAWLERG